jgi:hypothetical protein
MKYKLSRRALGALAGGLVAGGIAMSAQAGDGTFLETLDRGLWQLRAVGGGPSTAPVAQICLGDPSRLAQIQHGSSPCEHYVVRTNGNAITVSYSCKGQGQGLTTIRKESGRLIQIQSQGIRNNAPFSFAVEARRTGTC